MPTWTLAIDTSTYTQVLTLLEGDTLRAHLQTQPPTAHGATLLRAIDELLSAHELTPAQLDLLVVGLGPGSFTGLRVGLASVKGVARAAEVPLVGVSTLRALALEPALHARGELVCSAVDARKREVYAGFYRCTDPLTHQLETVIEESAYAPKQLAALLREKQVRTFAGFMTDKYAPLAPHTDDPFVTLREPLLAIDGVALATLGRQRFAAHGADSLATLEPNYIRPSDAEISLAKREAEAAANTP